MFPVTRYLYDIRWVRGWNSIYGHNERKNFVQLWATLPQHTSTMAHLLQQGAVLSTSFQPFEATVCCGCLLEERGWRGQGDKTWSLKNVEFLFIFV